MKSKSRFGVYLVLAVSLVACANMALFHKHALAQTQSASGNCGHWIDSDTGETVKTWPRGSDQGLRPDLHLGEDGKHAHGHGHNYNTPDDGETWIDNDTGQAVQTWPRGSDQGLRPDLHLGEDGKHAHGHGHNYVWVPCPPPTTAVEPRLLPTPKPTPTKPISSADTPMLNPLYGQNAWVSLGFIYERAPDETAKNLYGFIIEPSYNIKPSVAIAGEFSGAFGSMTAGTVRSSLHRFLYLAGPQFNFYPSDKVKVFAHALFGGVHDSGTTTIGTTSFSGSANAFAMEFGGGVDVRVSKRFAVRPVQFDYIPTHFGGMWQSNFRYSSGLVFRLGGH